MKSTESKREKEKQIVGDMIALYCHKNHHTPKGKMCPECLALCEYARSRSDQCPFMENKTFCSNCRVHCYRAEMREKIRTVMRYSGLRMIFHHPLAAISHVITSKKEKRKIRQDSH